MTTFGPSGGEWVCHTETWGRNCTLGPARTFIPKWTPQTSEPVTPRHFGTPPLVEQVLRPRRSPAPDGPDWGSFIGRTPYKGNVPVFFRSRFQALSPERPQGRWDDTPGKGSSCEVRFPYRRGTRVLGIHSRTDFTSDRGLRGPLNIPKPPKSQRPRPWERTTCPNSTRQSGFRGPRGPTTYSRVWSTRDGGKGVEGGEEDLGVRRPGGSSRSLRRW